MSRALTRFRIWSFWLTTPRRRAVAFLICLVILGSYSVAIFHSNGRFRRLVELTWFDIRGIHVRDYSMTRGFGFEMFENERGEWELWTDESRYMRDGTLVAEYPSDFDDCIAGGLIWNTEREAHLLMPTTIRYRQELNVFFNDPAGEVEAHLDEWRMLRQAALRDASKFFGVGFSRLRNVDEAEWVELRHPFGYVHNTIITLAAGVFLLLAPFVARDAWRARRHLAGLSRKRRRLRRGLCPNCAYPIRKLPTNRCPECGSVFSAHALDREVEGAP